MAKKKGKKLKLHKLQQMNAAALWGAGNGNGPMGNGAGLLARLARRPANQQFLMGALLGATAAYVLTDEQLRGKLLRAGMKMYAGVMGGLEEMKEQVADIHAEMQGDAREPG